MAICLMTPVDSILNDNRKRMLKELYASSSRKRQARTCAMQFVAACESGEEGSGDNWSCQQSSPSSDSPCSSHAEGQNKPTLPILAIPDELDGTWVSPRNNSRQSSPLPCHEAESRVCESCRYGARPSGKSVESSAANPSVPDCTCQGSSRRQPVELKTLSEVSQSVPSFAVLHGSVVASHRAWNLNPLAATCLFPCRWLWPFACPHLYC